MSNTSRAARPRFLTLGLTEEENATVADFAGDVRVAQAMSDIHAEEHDVLVAVGADFSGANGLFEYQLIFAPAPILNSRNLISSAPSRVQRPPLPVSGHNTSRLAISASAMPPPN